jgi:hypothetical protein
MVKQFKLWDPRFFPGGYELEGNTLYHISNTFMVCFPLNICTKVYIDLNGGIDRVKWAGQNKFYVKGLSLLKDLQWTATVTEYKVPKI